MTEKTLSYPQLHITPNDLLAEMGYRDVAPPEEVKKTALWVVSNSSRVVVPRFAYHVLPGHVDGDSATAETGMPSASVTIDGRCLEVGRIIAGQLHESDAFAIFVATAGREYEEWRHSLADSVREYVADALGTIIAERCADAMEQSLQASIDKLHWQRTNRFSPGYCSWDVAQQHALFALMGTNTCGVTLNDSALMYPIKSVSGIIGLGTNVKRTGYTCHLCNYKNCYKRKA